MKILAIDPGSSCGFAVMDAATGEVAVSGVWQLAPGRGDSPGMRYVRLRNHLHEIRMAYPDLRVLAYEQAHHRGGAATEYAVGVVTHIQSWCAEYGLEHTSAHSATIKKWATGRGNASKDEMVAAGRRKFPVMSIATDDEIDALWIADYARTRVA